MRLFLRVCFVGGVVVAAGCGEETFGPELELDEVEQSTSELTQTELSTPLGTAYFIEDTTSFTGSSGGSRFLGIACPTNYVVTGGGYRGRDANGNAIDVRYGGLTPIDTSGKTMSFAGSYNKKWRLSGWILCYRKSALTNYTVNFVDSAWDNHVRMVVSCPNDAGTALGMTSYLGVGSDYTRQPNVYHLNPFKKSGTLANGIPYQIVASEISSIGSYAHQLVTATMCTHRLLNITYEESKCPSNRAPLSVAWRAAGSPTSEPYYPARTWLKRNSDGTLTLDGKFSRARSGSYSIQTKMVLVCAR